MTRKSRVLPFDLEYRSSTAPHWPFRTVPIRQFFEFFSGRSRDESLWRMLGGNSFSSSGGPSIIEKENDDNNEDGDQKEILDSCWDKILKNAEPFPKIPPQTCKNPSPESTNSCQNQSVWGKFFGDPNSINNILFQIFKLGSILFWVFFFSNNFQSSDDRTDQCLRMRVDREILQKSILDFFQNSELSNRRKLFITTMSAVESALFSQNPTQPSVVTFVSSDNADVVNRSVIDLSDTINSNICPSIILKNNNSNEIPKFSSTNLDLTSGPDTTDEPTFRNKIRDLLRRNPVIVLSNLQSAPNQRSTVNVLHAFTDNNFAPFKQKVIFLTLFCSEFRSTMTEPEIAEIADKCLKKTFSQIDDDRLGSVISRLGIYVYFA